jgi:hypothetical protein
MKNFLTIAHCIDVGPLLEALAAQPELWDQLTIRTDHPQTAHGDASDIIVRFNKLTSDITSVIDDDDCVWYPSSFKLPVMPIIYNLMANIFGDRLGRCVITRLKPGKWIEPHIDAGSPVTLYQRFHLCLQNAEGAVFSIEDEHFTPVAGDLFWCANDKMHSVSNDSDIERLTMIIDVHTPLYQELKATR